MFVIFVGIVCYFSVLFATCISLPCVDSGHNFCVLLLFFLSILFVICQLYLLCPLRYTWVLIVVSTDSRILVRVCLSSLSVCLSIDMFIESCACLSVYPSICLPVIHSFTCPFVYLPVDLIVLVEQKYKKIFFLLILFSFKSRFIGSMND